MVKLPSYHYLATYKTRPAAQKVADRLRVGRVRTQIRENTQTLYSRSEGYEKKVYFDLYTFPRIRELDGFFIVSKPMHTLGSLIRKAKMGR